MRGTLPLLLAAAAAADRPDAKGDRFDAVRARLRDAVDEGAFPGCVAVVARGDETLFREAFGSLVYDGGAAPPLGPNAAVTPATRFDVASLTKVAATTTAAAKLYELGSLGFDTRAGGTCLHRALER